MLKFSQKRCFCCCHYLIYSSISEVSCFFCIHSDCSWEWREVDLPRISKNSVIVTGEVKMNSHIVEIFRWRKWWISLQNQKNLFPDEVFPNEIFYLCQVFLNPCKLGQYLDLQQYFPVPIENTAIIFICWIC